MRAYPKSSIVTRNQAFTGEQMPQKVLPMVSRGNVSLTAERRHLSLIVYAVPSERLRPLIPASFEIEETVLNGRRMAWVSVESFLDLNGAGQASFEQTNYRLHVLRDGEPCLWLLGSSIGSLSAVGTRNLWPVPWHLGAMEFQVAYDLPEGRYGTYRLRTQSQWASAEWQIQDTGDWLSLDEIQQLPASLQNSTAVSYFPRRDGTEGRQQEQRPEPLFTRGQLLSARCDLLERLGLVRAEELKRPQFIALQHNLSCRFGAPSAVGAVHNEKFLRAA